MWSVEITQKNGSTQKFNVDERLLMDQKVPTAGGAKSMMWIPTDGVVLELEADCEAVRILRDDGSVFAGYLNPSLTLLSGVLLVESTRYRYFYR